MTEKELAERLRGLLIDPEQPFKDVIEQAAARLEQLDKDAERYRWLRQHLEIIRDEPGDWTCWLELPCFPFRSKTEDAEELLDALMARFPLCGEQSQ